LANPLAVSGVRPQAAGCGKRIRAQVVDVSFAADRIEQPHLVDHGGEEIGVVADDDKAAVMRREEIAEPGDRIGIEMVGRLVEQQRGVRACAGTVRGAEQDPGQLDPAALAAGQRVQRLGQHAVGQT
jgi:hypothetical protein